MGKRMTRRERRHCPHSNLRGIYGDEVWQVPGFRRLQCRDCWQVLDGPPQLAEIRRASEPDVEGSER